MKPIATKTNNASKETTVNEKNATRTAEVTAANTKEKTTMKKKNATKTAEVTAANTKEKTTMKKKNATKTAGVTATNTKEEATMKKNATKTAEVTATNPKEEATMKTIAKTPVAATTNPNEAPTTSSSTVLQLQALEKTCGYGDPLPEASRTASEILVRRIPTSIVERVLTLAVREKGVVAGIALDPDAAQAALAAADEADAVATAGEMLVRRAQDQSIRLRAGVAGTVSAIRMALRGYVKSSEGAALAQENDELRSLAKQHNAAAKARKSRKDKAVKDAIASAGGAAETPGSAVTTTQGAPIPPTIKAS